MSYRVIARVNVAAAVLFVLVAVALAIGALWIQALAWLMAAVAWASAAVAWRLVALREAQPSGYTVGWAQGVADTGAALIGLAAAELGPNDLMVDRMVERLGSLAGDDRYTEPEGKHRADWELDERGRMHD